MTQVWDKSPLDGSRLLILLALADMANDDGYCWPSYATLAKRARLKSRQNVIKIMNEFIEVGIVEKKGRVDDEGNQTSNMYHVIAGNINKEIPSTTSATSVNTDTTPSVNTDTPLVSVLTPESSFNRHIESTTRGAPQKNFYSVYESNIGGLTSMTAEMLKELETEYSLEWFEAAIQEAIKANVRKLNYVMAVLGRWKVDGFKAERKPAQSYGKKPATILGRSKPYTPPDPAQVEALRIAFETTDHEDTSWLTD